jgi:HD superfamily phosphodiesterase
MNVLHFAHDIYEAEKENYPILEKQEKIIYVAAVLHDMCDKKYMDEEEGLKRISTFLSDKMTPEDIDVTKRIINTMSYSKVKVKGFPELHEYQMAYHLVREADLLSAYDFDRCMLYNIHCKTVGDENMKILDAFNDASELFQRRVLRHNKDGLFVTGYSKHNYLPLHIDAVKRMNAWKLILRKTVV